MSLAEVLEEAASEFSQYADTIRPANGDPLHLLATLDPAAAAEVLGFVLSRDVAAGEELALNWSEDLRGIDPIHAVSESSLPKPGRKVLRRIRHRIRSRGIEAPPRERVEPRVARLPEISDSIGSAHLCRVDPQGSYLAFLIESHPSQGARLFRIAMDEGRGILDFEVYTAGRSKLRDFLKELRSSRSGAVDADAASIRCLVSRLADAHPSDRVLPNAFSEWRRKLAEGAADETPGEQVRRTLGPADDPQAAATRVAERIRSAELGPWPPASDVPKRVAEALEAAVHKLEGATEDERRAAIEEQLETAIVAHFDEPHCARTERRLLHAAYVDWKSGREAEARDCLAVAASFCDAGSEQNFVARALVEACYSPLLERLENAGGTEIQPVDARAES